MSPPEVVVGGRTLTFFKGGPLCVAAVLVPRMASSVSVVVALLLLLGLFVSFLIRLFC